MDNAVTQHMSIDSKASITSQKRRPKSGSKQPKQILVVDDHPFTRSTLVKLIHKEPDLEICGEADSAAKALELVKARSPDLVLLEISLSDKSGLEFIGELQVFHPTTPVLVISMYDELLYAERVLRAGARGYVMKRESAQRLLQAVRQVLGDRIFLSEAVSASILKHIVQLRAAIDQQPGPSVDAFSDREFEIFHLMADGRTARQIAEHLHLSVKTVEVHRAHMRGRLSLRNAADLAKYALRWAESRRVGAGV